MTLETFERMTMGLIRELSRGMTGEPFLLHEKYDDTPEGVSPLALVLTGGSDFERIAAKRVGFSGGDWDARFGAAEVSDEAVRREAKAAFAEILRSGGLWENALEYAFFALFARYAQGAADEALIRELRALALDAGAEEAAFDDVRRAAEAIFTHPEDISLKTDYAIRRYGPILRYMGIPTKLYMCRVCCCCYDAIHGPFSALPADWTCPDCGAGKDSYAQVPGAYTLSKGVLPEIGSRDPGQARIKPRRQ